MPLKPNAPEYAAKAALERVVVVYETVAAAAARLLRFGYDPTVAAEIADYLAQATDLPAYFDEIGDALAARSIEVEFLELDDFSRALSRLAEKAASTMLWAQTDGIRFYRGSGIAFAARLGGFARFGATPAAQAMCQNKFHCLALAQSAGLRIAPTLLLEGAETIAALGNCDDGAGDWFVKPNTLGAKIGIFADSRCATLAEARARCARLWERYGDRALIQSFIPGDDVRVSFMNTGGGFAQQLGIAQLLKDPASETAGAFMTMRDNATLSGAKDLHGGRGGFGLSNKAAFTPGMADLKAASDARSKGAVAAISTQVEQFAGLVGLADYFSADFRLNELGEPIFFEFEVCPAVTIYDFQSYLASVHQLSLGEALARSFQLAYARRLTKVEA